MINIKHYIHITTLCSWSERENYIWWIVRPDMSDSWNWWIKKQMFSTKHYEFMTKAVCWISEDRANTQTLHTDSM